MEWQIKTIGRRSALSGEAFNPGDRVVCLIFKDDAAGELARADVLAEEIDQYALPGEALGRWSRVVKDPGEEGAHARETMASAEDFFFSLFEDGGLAEEEGAVSKAEEVSDMLKHLVALMLERKRVLRALGARKTSGQQNYLHVKTRREFSVPVAAISTDLMLKIEATIGDILL